MKKRTHSSLGLVMFTVLILMSIGVANPVAVDALAHSSFESQQTQAFDPQSLPEIVARVNGEEITRALLIERADAMNSQLGVQSSSLDLYKKALDDGVDQFGMGIKPEVIVELVKNGEIPEDRIDESVRRLLKVKFELGLFENPFVDPAYAKEFVGNRDFQTVADLAQRKSIVLLKNSDAAGNRVLPLASATKIYVEDIDPATAAHYGTVVETLAAADVAILRVKTPYETGPGRFGGIHMGNLRFHGEELAHIRSIMAAKPTIIAVYLDRPAVLTDIEDQAAALLGTFGASDAALLDIIFGKFAPTGKLPFELPSSMDAVEVQFEDVPYDSENPLFEFGFGLAY